MASKQNTNESILENGSRLIYIEKTNLQLPKRKERGEGINKSMEYKLLCIKNRLVIQIYYIAEDTIFSIL